MTEQVRGSELAVSSVVGGVPAAGIQWAGEFHLLRMLGEKDAFVTQLARLGYKLNDFRVTVRRITGDGRKQIRYNVFVDELRDGRPYRGKAYLAVMARNGSTNLRSEPAPTSRKRRPRHDWLKAEVGGPTGQKPVSRSLSIPNLEH
jgi:hypothetical protein